VSIFQNGICKYALYFHSVKTFNRKEYKILIELLYQVRINSGLRQSDIAERLNMPQSYISKIESGERRIDIIELLDICKALNIDFKDFLIKFSNKLSVNA
jgi:transcriptional regulator with XRE-family HTH domain